MSDQPLAARALLERAVTIYDAHDGAQFLEHVLRFELARLLVRTGGDRTRALAEARKAADGMRADDDPRIAEVEAFLAEQPSKP